MAIESGLYNFRVKYTQNDGSVFVAYHERCFVYDQNHLSLIYSEYKNKYESSSKDGKIEIRYLPT